MPDVPEVKLILSLTIVFVIGTFVFIVIFRALTLFQEFQSSVMGIEQDSRTVQLLQAVPWALGGLYFTLVGVIAYFMYKKYKKEHS